MGFDLIIQGSSNGRQVKVQGVVPSWTILRVIRAYAAQVGDDPASVRLLCRGQTLRQDMTLNQYGNIDLSDSTLTFQAVYRVVGGPAVSNSDPDDEKKSHIIDAQEFGEQSARKKTYYKQFTSLRDLTVNDLDGAVKVKDPHFVVTLSNLDDFLHHYDEREKLRELKQCVSNKQFNNPILDSMRQKLANIYSVTKARIVINDVFVGTTNIAYYVNDYHALGVEKFVTNKDEFILKFKTQFQKSFEELVITPPPPSNDGAYEIIKSYHVSCASSKPCDKWNCALPEHNLAGAVLYMNDGKTDWYCNGRHCKIGYIIVKTVESCKSENSAYGAVHGNIYKSVFKEEPKNVVGSGFARQSGNWKWNSGSFNLSHDSYHSSDAQSKGYKCENKSMSQIEQKWIEKAVKQWFQTRKQNITVDESLVIFKNQK